MPGSAAIPIVLRQAQQKIIEQIVRCQTSEQRLVRRAQILLKANAGLNNEQIAQALNINRETVQRWRQRWSEGAEALAVEEAQSSTAKLLRQRIHSILMDHPRTGTPAWERAYPDHPMSSGKVKLQEFEYIRHGACCLIANWNVALGQVVSPSLLPSRKEFDFANHIARTIETEPDAGWVFLVDQLNTHQSASLVRLVAACCKLDIELGIKGKSGILESMATRARFLSDQSHRIRFVYIPKHTSWLNQIECW